MTEWPCGRNPLGEVVPRILVACGHTFCEGCLSMMLRCATRARSHRHHRALQRSSGRGKLMARFVGRPLPAASGRKQLECPRCRRRCSVKGGHAMELPTNYDIMGA